MQKLKDGEDYLKVTILKCKLGEEAVREIAVLPTYGKGLLVILLALRHNVHVNLQVIGVRVGGKWLNLQVS